MVDFPEPEAPTSADILPAANESESPCNTGTSGREEYVK